MSGALSQVSQNREQKTQSDIYRMRVTRKWRSRRNMSDGRRKAMKREDYHVDAFQPLYQLLTFRQDEEWRTLFIALRELLEEKNADWEGYWIFWTHTEEPLESR
jgi:hypothetical protein